MSSNSGQDPATDFFRKDAKGEYEVQGVLSKRGVFNKAFKKRAFRLDRGRSVLDYYGHVMDMRRNANRRGSIPLDKNTVLSRGTDSKLFEIKTAGRTYVLQAESESVLNAWIAALGQFIEAQGGKNAWDASPHPGGAGGPSSAAQGAPAPDPAHRPAQGPGDSVVSAQENPPSKSHLGNFSESGDYMAGPASASASEADPVPAYSSYAPYAAAGDEEDAGPDAAGEMGQPLPDSSGGYGPYAAYAAYAPEGGEEGGEGLAAGASSGYSPYSPYEDVDSGEPAELGTTAASGAAEAPEAPPAADAGKGEKPRAGGPRQLTQKGADSNEWLRRLQERPCTSESEAREASMALGKMARSFINYATTVTTVLSCERGVPEEDRLIKPLDVGGVAGGSKYLAYNIFFKVPVDEHGIYGHEHWALKAAMHELRGANYLLACRDPELGIPLMASVTAFGMRIMCTGLLPIGSKTICYGTADATKTMYGIDDVPHEETRESLKRASKMMNLKPHIVEGGNKAVECHFAADVEGHLGKGDGRFYMLDTARTLPPTKPCLHAAITHIPADERKAETRVPLPWVQGYTGGHGGAWRKIVEAAKQQLMEDVHKGFKDLSPDDAFRRLHTHACMLGRGSMVTFPPTHAEAMAKEYKRSSRWGFNRRASALAGKCISGPALLITCYGLRGEIFHDLMRPELLVRCKTPVSSDAYSRFGKHNAKEHNADADAVTERLLTEFVPEAAGKLDQRAQQAKKADKSAQRWMSAVDISSVLHDAGVNLRYLGLVRSHMKTAAGRGLVMSELVARCARTEAQQRIRQVKSFTTTKDGEPKEVYMIALSMMNALLGHGQQGHLWWHVTAKELIAVAYHGALTADESKFRFDLRKSLPKGAMPQLLTRFSRKLGFEMELPSNLKHPLQMSVFKKMAIHANVTQLPQPVVYDPHANRAEFDQKMASLQRRVQRACARHGDQSVVAAQARVDLARLMDALPEKQEEGTRILMQCLGVLRREIKPELQPPQKPAGVGEGEPWWDEEEGEERANVTMLQQAPPPPPGGQDWGLEGYEFPCDLKAQRVGEAESAIERVRQLRSSCPVESDPRMEYARQVALRMSEVSALSHEVSFVQHKIVENHLRCNEAGQAERVARDAVYVATQLGLLYSGQGAAANFFLARALHARHDAEVAGPTSSVAGDQGLEGGPTPANQGSPMLQEAVHVLNESIQAYFLDVDAPIHLRAGLFPLLELFSIHTTLQQWDDAAATLQRIVRVERRILGAKKQGTVQGGSKVDLTRGSTNPNTRAPNEMAEAMDKSDESLVGDLGSILDKVGTLCFRTHEWRLAFQLYARAAAALEQTNSKSVAANDAMHNVASAAIRLHRDAGADAPAGDRTALRAAAEELIALAADIEPVAEAPADGAAAADVALSTYLRALEGKEKVAGDNSESTAKTLFAVAYMHYDAGRNDDAWPYAKRCLDARVKVLPDGHFDRTEVRRLVANLHGAKNEREPEMRQHELCFREHIARHGASQQDKRLATIAQELRGAAVASGKEAEIEPLLNQHGFKRPDAGAAPSVAGQAAQNPHAALQQGTREAIQAEQLSQQAMGAFQRGNVQQSVELWDQSLGFQPTNPLILFNVSCACCRLGQLDRAMDYFGRCVSNAIQLNVAGKILGAARSEEEFAPALHHPRYQELMKQLESGVQGKQGSGGPAAAGAAGGGAPQGQAHPAGAMPHGAMPQGAMPQGAMPHGAMPHGAMPQGAMPQGAMPQGAMPHGAMPHGAMPQGAMPQGAMPQGAQVMDMNQLTQLMQAQGGGGGGAGAGGGGAGGMNLQQIMAMAQARQQGQGGQQFMQGQGGMPPFGKR